ncbi:MAG TPA: hypothetical protein VMV18_15100 [bacterium]|nr:hypothetical protein [bacterium]
MEKLEWEEVFKRVRAILREAYPDRAEALVEELVRHEPDPEPRYGYDICRVCGRRSGDGRWTIYRLWMSVGRRRADRYRNPQRAMLDREWPPRDPFRAYVCEFCARDLLACVDEPESDPPPPPRVADATLADIIRAVRGAGRTRVEELVVALERAFTPVRSFTRGTDVCANCGVVENCFIGQRTALCGDCVRKLEQPEETRS